MRAAWHALAVLGLLTLVAAAGIGIKYGRYYDDLRALDPEAGQIYAAMARELLETGSAPAASVRAVEVDEGLTVGDVERVMRFVANQHNIANVGELPLSRQVEKMTGEPFRFVKIYMLCDPLTAKRMLQHDDAYAAYLPCRITLVEDVEGRLWLYTLNMDFMIHGGAPLPEDLRKEAEEVRRTIYDIMDRAARGAF
ncbi:MAG: DUF302 domain-containing protein [Gammaproteobacteria bacterium]|nr:DUF302 domain-containing protein [Gammaproteobacteria bacterium]NIR60618.1 DUF302 domain-containing protein [Gammaproteobacteria bacterium]